MKKLLFVLVAIAMSIAAQANSVVWGVQINSATSAGVGASDYVAYLLDNSVWSTYVDTETGVMKQGYLTEGAFDSANFTANGSRLQTGNQTADGLPVGSINYAVVLVSSDSSNTTTGAFRFLTNNGKYPLLSERITSRYISSRLVAELVCTNITEKSTTKIIP